MKHHLEAASLVNSSPTFPRITRRQFPSMSPEAVRAREKYERDRKNLLDPLTPFLIYLSDSEINKIIMLIALHNPALRDMPRDDAKFLKSFARALRPFIQHGIRELPRAAKKSVAEEKPHAVRIIRRMP